MKSLKKMNILLSIIFVFIIIVAIIASGHENVGNPTVREILKGDPGVDLIKLDELSLYQFITFRLD